MQTLAGTILNPQSPDLCEILPGSVARIDADGRFAEVARGATSSTDVVGGEGYWILPGFVDAHLHLPQWDRRGIDGLSLYDWLEQVVYPAEARMKDPDLTERVAEAFVTGLVANGTTTAAAFGSPFAKSVDRAFQVFDRRGFRAMYGMMLNDVNCPDALCTPADKALDESRALAATWHNAHDGLLRYAFSPRMATSCSEKMMRGVAALAEVAQCHIQTHVAESYDEEYAVRERFADQLDDVDVFAEMGMLTPRTLLGHGVCLTGSMRQRVAESRTSVVHCPTANLFLEAGLMDYVAHRKAGVKVALGSSIAAGYEPFIPKVAVACLQTAKVLKVHAIPRQTHAVPSPAEAWWLATRGGAEALGWSDRIGAIEPGLDADCLVVRPEPWISELPVQQQVSALLYTIRPHQIEHVFIAGKRVGP